MHIVYDNIIFSLQSFGGISVVWQELLTHMIDMGRHSLHFIEYQHNDNNPFRRKIDLDGRDVIIKSSLLLPIKRYFNPGVKFNEPFIFHSSYFRTCPNNNAINITTVHDFTYEYFREGLAKQIHCMQKYEAIRKSEAIICISKNTKRDLLRFLPDIDADKVHVIYNGVSNDYHVIEKKRTEGLPFPAKTYLVFVGSRESYKNFDFVLRGIAKTDYNLVIVGSTLTSTEQQTINSLLPRNRFKAVGFLSNEDLNVVYNNAAALAYPSSYEGFGIPIIEAQRAGCPVIALGSSSIPEVIGETPLLMNQLSDSEFASKLDLLSNEELIANVVNHGLNNSKRFSWERMAREYNELYCSFI